MPDMAKIRREGMRWNLIATLNKFRPYTTPDMRIVEVMQAIYPDSTMMEVRRELDYLEDRKLLTLDRTPSGTWYADLTHYGVDIAEYTCECFPGIGRPEKYWSE